MLKDSRSFLKTHGWAAAMSRGGATVVVSRSARCRLNVSTGIEISFNMSWIANSSSDERGTRSIKK